MDTLYRTALYKIVFIFVFNRKINCFFGLFIFRPKMENPFSVGLSYIGYQYFSTFKLIVITLLQTSC